MATRPLPKVLATPTLSPGSLLFAPRGARPEPLASGSVRFFHQARYALWHAAAALGLGPGDSVLVPAFQCGTELDGFLARGVALRFYRVDRSLAADVSALERAAGPDTRAVLVTHYFGIPQPLAAVRAFCSERRLFLIEDCAHTLHGRDGDRFLGTAGDVSIFSIRKMLPTPDGGALRVNRGDLLVPSATGAPPLSVTLEAIKVKVARHLAHRGGGAGRAFKAAILSPLARLSRPGRPSVPDPERALAHLYRFYPERAAWGMSALSRRILDGADAESMARRRHEHFGVLLRGLAAARRVAPLVRSLPEGACPWMFPIEASDPEGLVAHLVGRGIEIGRFWQYHHPSFPAAAFPEAAELKRRVLTLPVHQDLEAVDLRRIVEAVLAWDAAAAPARRAL